MQADLRGAKIRDTPKTFGGSWKLSPGTGRRGRCWVAARPPTQQPTRVTYRACFDVHAPAKLPPKSALAREPRALPRSGAPARPPGRDDKLPCLPAGGRQRQVSLPPYRTTRQGERLSRETARGGWCTSSVVRSRYGSRRRFWAGGRGSSRISGELKVAAVLDAAALYCTSAARHTRVVAYETSTSLVRACVRT